MYRIFFFIIIISFSFSSCKKYLDKKSDSSLIVPQSIADLQALLNDGDFQNFNTPSYGESSADDYFLQLHVYNRFVQEEQKRYTWQPVIYNYQNDWSLCYRAVYPANLCLERLEKIPVTADNRTAWNNVKGAALFYRAWQFWQLTVLFAKAFDESSADKDLGIVLRLSSDFNLPSSRATVRQSYQQILDDCKNAIPYLPDWPQFLLQPSKASCYGLLTRTFLAMRQYDSAGKYAGLCLKIKDDLMDYNDPSWVDVQSDLPFQPMNPETIFYTTMNRNVILYLPLIGSTVDTMLYQGYQSGDIRKDAFFARLGKYYQFKGTYSGDDFAFFSGIATDEMYLTMAECKARTGNISEAMNYLNTLLQKRWLTGQFVPLTASDKDQAIQIILTERRKELLMRGLRWIDIKRLNKETADITLTRIINGQTYTLPPNDNRYALPLPDDVVKLGNLQQN